jgi:hypothetical protein
MHMEEGARVAQTVGRGHWVDGLQEPRGLVGQLLQRFEVSIRTTPKRGMVDEGRQGAYIIREHDAVAGIARGPLGGERQRQLIQLIWAHRRLEPVSW